MAGGGLARAAAYSGRQDATFATLVEKSRKSRDLRTSVLVVRAFDALPRRRAGPYDPFTEPEQRGGQRRGAGGRLRRCQSRRFCDFVQ